MQVILAKCVGLATFEECGVGLVMAENLVRPGPVPGVSMELERLNCGCFVLDDPIGRPRNSQPWEAPADLQLCRGYCGYSAGLLRVSIWSALLAVINPEKDIQK